MISVMVLVCSWERIARLRTFPFWDGYCNYLSRRDVYKNKILCLSYLNLVLTVDQYGNVFGDSTSEEGGLRNLQVLRKVIAISGKYVDYIDEIQASHKFGYPAYRIAPEGSPMFVFTYESKVFCLGAHHQHIYEQTPLAVTKTHYLAYWKEDSRSGGNATSIKR